MPATVEGLEVPLKKNFRFTASLSLTRVKWQVTLLKSIKTAVRAVHQPARIPVAYAYLSQNRAIL